MLEPHALGDALRFQPDSHGLTRALIHTPACTGEIYLLGAHVTQWHPVGTQPVLFMSSKAVFEEGKPIRGGVPICFPWFGPHPGDASAPMHGTVRTKPWAVRRTARDGDAVTLELETDAGDLHAVFTATFGDTLTMTLTATNRGRDPHPVSNALHTYLQVGDVRRVHVTGLRGATYQDKVLKGQRFTEDSAELRLTGETDRVYLDSPGPCVLHDPVLKRRITVDKSGSRSTVVWNIWGDRVANMSDMGAQDWPHYLCIESANALDNALTLAPNQSHALTQTLRVEAE